MFWDGSRWVDDRTSAPVLPPRRRARDWLATAVMIVGVAALAVPFVGTSAAMRSGDRLLAAWKAGFETRVFQESSILAAFTGDWSVAADDRYLGGQAAISRQANATVNFTFTGSAISWIGSEGPDQGSAWIYVDGEFVRTVDTYSRRPRSRETIYTASFPTVGLHTLTIQARVTPGRPALTVDAWAIRGASLSEQAPAPTPPAAVVAPAPAPDTDPTATPSGAPPSAASPSPTTSPTPTPKPSASPSPSPSPTPSPTPTPKPSASPTPSPSPSTTPSPTPKPSASPSPTPSPSPSPTPTPAAGGCGTSLQAKVDAAPAGGTLDLSGCSYAAGATIDKPLTITGGRVNVPSGTRGFIVTASNVTLDGLTISGPGASTYSWNEVGVLSTGSVSNLVVRNSTIRSFGNAGIWVGPSSGARISGNTIEDAVYAGIMVISASGARVDGNVVRRIGVNGAGANGNNAYGIAVSNEGGAVSSDVAVDGNTVETVPTWHGLDTHGGVRVSFTNNTVSGAPRALFITTDNSGRRPTDITVTGNRFLSPLPATTNLDTITTYQASGVTVTGNTASGWGSASFFYDYLGQSTGLVVSGNTVTP